MSVTRRRCSSRVGAPRRFSRVKPRRRGSRLRGAQYRTATGTCSGTITSSNGRTRQLNDAAAEYRATEFGAHESCLSDLDAVGQGALAFGQGSVRFGVVENRVSGQAALSYTGLRGGSAVGVAYVNSADPAGLLEQCATTGLTSSPVDIVFQTTPEISG